MKLVTRSQWGARPAKPNCIAQLPFERIDGWAVHYSGTASDLDGDPILVLRSHQNFHLDTRGWCDIAYTLEFDRRGTFYEARGYGKRTAAQGTDDGNDRFYAVCYQGADKIGRQDFTKAAQASLSALFREFRQQRGKWPEVRPHSHFHTTECPGGEIRSWIALEPWKLDWKPWPGPLPKWWWRWNAWRLAEGDYKGLGKRNPRLRVTTGAPRIIPPWAWVRAVAFDRAREKPAG